MPRYRAKEPGYDNVKLREVGEEFDFEGKPGPWMERVDAEEKGKSKSKAKAEDEK
jgi:hypothetical protein